RSSWRIGGKSFPSAIATVSGILLPDETNLPIDFSIAPSSFAFVSYADLLNGRVPPTELEGKTVLIGATAIELGDMVPVPLHQSLPGVVVQALAAQTARQGPLHQISSWAYLPVLAIWAALCAALFHGRSWRSNLLVMSGTLALACAASVYLFAAQRVVFDVAPLLLIVIGAFLIVTIRSLDEQTMRAIAHALGLRERDALIESIV